MRLRVLFGHEGHTDAVERGADDHLDIVDDQRAAHRDGQLFPLIELLPVHAFEPCRKLMHGQDAAAVGRRQFACRTSAAGNG